MADHFIGDTELRKVQLDLFKVGASFVADRAYVERFEDAELDIVNRLQYQLSSYVLADHLVRDPYPVTFTWRVPLSWWQHFKEQYRDKWWLRRFVRRWPVKYDRHDERRSVTFDRYATYPDARIRVPDLGPVYMLEQVTEDWRR